MCYDYDLDNLYVGKAYDQQVRAFIILPTRVSCISVALVALRTHTLLPYYPTP